MKVKTQNLAATCCTNGPSAEKVDSLELHKLAVMNKQQGHWGVAGQMLKQALEADPSKLEYWISCIDYLLQAGLLPQMEQMLADVCRMGAQGPDIDELQNRLKQAKLDAAQQALWEQSGAYDLMEQSARNAWEQFGPNPARAHALGKALLLQRNNSEALPYLKQACDGAPLNINAWNQCGLALNHLGQFAEAEACYQQALTLLPNSADVLANLAANSSDAGNYRKAIEYTEQALTVQPSHVSARVNQANALHELHRFEEAEHIFQGLYLEGIRHPLAMATQVLNLRAMGDLARARMLMEELIAIAPNVPEARNAEAEIALDMGDFARAQQALSAILEQDHNNVAALSSLVKTRKMTVEDHAWRERSEQSIQTALPAKKKSELSYALGKYFNDIGDYGSAFEYYRQANQTKQSFFPAYDRLSQESAVETLTTCYTQEVCHKKWPSSSNSERPVLVVGMPRSGTSLIEQIMASHPSVHGAGELSLWPSITTANKKATLTAQWDESTLKQIAEVSLATLEKLNDEALRVVDKMPGNFLSLGMVHAVFPNAKIIHIQRNPIDTCLSIYFQNFDSGHQYANDLDDLAHYYREYHRLMAHWRAVLPAEVFLDVPYEAVVEDQEAWSRKIIDFIGLEWDDRCLAFHKTERKVGTASNWQVRQPIYKTSKERWRNYEQFVGPLLPLLELYNPVKGQP